MSVEMMGEMPEGVEIEQSMDELKTRLVDEAREKGYGKFAFLTESIVDILELDKNGKPLNAAKAIGEAQRTYLDSLQVDEKEKKQIFEAMHHMEFAVLDALKEVFHDTPAYNGVSRVHDFLNYGWEESGDEDDKT